MANASKSNGHKAKNGSARRGKGGNGVPSDVHRVDLQFEDLDVLLKACQKFRASLPGYLASAQADVARADALIAKLRAAIDKH